ncbi:hypothetical protein DFH27DRAFT_567039 [Peziza echinospora]|nr:hypothetical protein DFH27DRAFT_567039 [Peziza echinospora]
MICTAACFMIICVSAIVLRWYGSFLEGGSTEILECRFAIADIDIDGMGSGLTFESVLQWMAYSSTQIRYTL